MFDITGVTAQGSEKRSVSVHDNEPKGLVRFQELAQCFGVEFVVTQIQRGIDGLERLEIYVDLSLLALGGDDFTTVDNQTIWRDFGVELETLLGRGDGGQDGESIDTRFDV